MFRLIGSHFRRDARTFDRHLNQIAQGIETDNPELKQAGLRGLGRLLFPRLFLWGPGAVYYAIKGSGLLEGYIWFIIIFYIIGAGIAICTQAPEPAPQMVVSPDDAVVMKNAKAGLEVLLDHIFIVSESLAEQTEIYAPRTLGELAYPDKTRCITIEDGVAVVTVRLDYAGEIVPAQFLERFNDRMAQKLNSGELRDKPPAVFTDKDNTPHTSIQAIRCVPVQAQRYIRLEVIRVNQTAVALLDKIARANAPETDGEHQLYDDEL